MTFAQPSVTVWNIYIHAIPCSHAELDALFAWRVPGSTSLHQPPLCSVPRQEADLDKLRFPGESGQWGVSAGEEGRWGDREEGRRERCLLPRLSPCRVAANQLHPQLNPRVLAAQRPTDCSVSSSFNPGEAACELCPLSAIP